MSVGPVANKDTLSIWETVLGPSRNKKTRTQEEDNKLRDQVFSELDRDEDDKLTAGEFGLDKESFLTFDLNSDGSITTSEFKRALKLKRKQLEVNMERESKVDGSSETISIRKLLDGDKNESVSAEELAVALPKNWHVQRAGSGYKLNGKIFSKKDQALAYAFAQSSNMLSDAVSNIVGNEEIAERLLTEQSKTTTS